MNGMKPFFDDLSRKAEALNESNESDFYNNDGLLVCGICGRKKQTRIIIAGQATVVSCICDCVKKREQDKEKERKIKENMMAVERLRTASLMDKRFKDASFDNFHENEHNRLNLKLCNRYVNNFEKMAENNQGLLFWGSVGTGKSYAAACIANKLMENGTPVVMTSFVKLLEIIQKGYDEEAEIQRILNLAKLVIFDDLGAERNTNYALEKVYNIVDGRYRVKRPMILTTNLTMKDIMDETDDRYRRIYDRILEVCFPIEFTGPSWRKKIAGARFEQMKSLLMDE